jgi:hypothetical protein
MVSTTSEAGPSIGTGSESGTANPSTVARRNASSSPSPVSTSTFKSLAAGTLTGSAQASSFSKPFST